jgi:hypothetical protein
LCDLFTIPGAVIESKFEINSLPSKKQRSTA